MQQPTLQQPSVSMVRYVREVGAAFHPPYLYGQLGRTRIKQEKEKGARELSECDLHVKTV